MIDLPNIEKAAGLSAEDKAVLSELVEVSRSVAARNRELDLYYEGEQQTPDIGIDNIPRQVDPGVRCDWARKAVTSVSERVRMDGFVFEGDYEDEGFARIVRENSLDAEFNRNVASELTHGCMFATVNRIGESVAIRMHTAEDSAAIWDVANQRIGAGIVVADARRTDYSRLRPVPTQVNLHLPERVVVLRRAGETSWTAEALPHPLDRPLMEAFCFRATGLKPFGQTRITRAVRYLVDEVERTLRYMAVSSAFYATPQRYIMGLTDEQYDAMMGIGEDGEQPADGGKASKWRTLIGSILLSTRDDDGNVPTAGQFSAASPQPYVDAIQMYAKLFSGATGVPLNSLGIVQDNPSSAEAIAAQREDICTAAEDCIESNRESMRSVALMAMAVERDTTIEGLTDEQRSVMPHFRNPNMPSLAATADAMTKIASVMDGFSSTREFLSGMGFEASEVESIRSQLRKQQARSTALATAQAALAQRQQVTDAGNSGEA